MLYTYAFLYFSRGARDCFHGIRRRNYDSLLIHYKRILFFELCYEHFVQQSFSLIAFLVEKFEKHVACLYRKLKVISPGRKFLCIDVFLCLYK